MKRCSRSEPFRGGREGRQSPAGVWRVDQHRVLQSVVYVLDADKRRGLTTVSLIPLLHDSHLPFRAVHFVSPAALHGCIHRYSTAEAVFAAALYRALKPTLTSNWTHATRSSDLRYAGAGELREGDGGDKGVLILLSANVGFGFGFGGSRVMYDLIRGARKTV